MAESFDVAKVEAALVGTRFAGRVHHFPVVGSTNALALEQAQAGAADGSVYVADEQVSGRGRGGHGWHSAGSDGLYVSVLLRPAMAMTDALWIALATGMAAQRGILATTQLLVDIRWPNDLMVDGRKCGGILVETSVSAARDDGAAMLRHAVIGVGINVNHASFPAELEAVATSIRRESGQVWQREQVLAGLLLGLEQEMEWLEEELRGAGTQMGLLERFGVASSWVRGKRVRVDEEGGYTGVTAGLDTRGFLLVAGDDGVLHTVLSGGVRPS